MSSNAMITAYCHSLAPCYSLSSELLVLVNSAYDGDDPDYEALQLFLTLLILLEKIIGIYWMRSKGFAIWFLGHTTSLGTVLYLTCAGDLQFCGQLIHLVGLYASFWCEVYVSFYYATVGSVLNRPVFFYRFNVIFIFIFVKCQDEMLYFE